ncbi:MAG: hypothetical protein NUW09_07825, partial [Deltaproteobacteria bacterium]|nr:hypothetical protein [Deltaproteobacteria bacterium]
SSAQLTTAADFMEEVKNDVHIKAAVVQKKLRSLFMTSFLVASEGKHRYALPTDFLGDLTLTLMDGTHTGTATGGAVGYITLAADEDITEDEALGKYALVTSGTGAASCSQITAYSTTTKVATVTPNFTTAPESGSGYMIADRYRLIRPTNSLSIDSYSTPTIKGEPHTFAMLGDKDTGEILIYPTPDDTYGLQLRYYVDLSLVDLTDDRMSTLYRKWRNLWIQGVYAKQLQSDDDNKATAEMKRYYEYIDAIIFDETSGQDLGEVQFQVELR